MLINQPSIPIIVLKTYREIYEKGEFKDLLYYAGLDDSDEGKFWQVIAFLFFGTVDNQTL